MSKCQIVGNLMPRLNYNDSACNKSSYLICTNVTNKRQVGVPRDGLNIDTLCLSCICTISFENGLLIYTISTTFTDANILLSYQVYKAIYTAQQKFSTDFNLMSHFERT